MGGVGDLGPSRGSEGILGRVHSVVRGASEEARTTTSSQVEARAQPPEGINASEVYRCPACKPGGSAEPARRLRSGIHARKCDVS